MPDALMRRLLQPGVLATPHPLDPPHACCWMAAEDNQCGLWCGHDGEHIPYVPGVYLPPLIISPLGLLPFQRGEWPMACPLCGTRVSCAGFEAPLRVLRDGDGSASWFEPEDGDADVECAWRFEPCGCEGRETLPHLATSGGQHLLRYL
ncbi:hypothetical protein ACIGMX_34550 [Streptomyces aquilus]|uniref:hypothetical protein n=1 Tax=Streptomyces aquilus TaxID=2548456 RepID=UPI0037D330B7